MRRRALLLVPQVGLKGHDGTVLRHTAWRGGKGRGSILPVGSVNDQRNVAERSWFERHSDVILFGAGLIMVLAGVLLENNTAVKTTLVLIGAGVLLVGALLPRIGGIIRLSPRGFEIPLDRADQDATERAAQSVLSSSELQATAPVREPLELYARRYEEARRAMKPGGQRTERMAQIMADVRALADRVAYTAKDARDLFESGTDGGRVVALALLRAKPAGECFDLVMKGIGRESRSAFEQYQALRAAEGMLPQLPREARRQLRELLEDPRTVGRWDGRDLSRRELGDRLLASIATMD